MAQTQWQVTHRQHNNQPDEKTFVPREHNLWQLMLENHVKTQSQGEGNSQSFNAHDMIQSNVARDWLSYPDLSMAFVFVG